MKHLFLFLSLSIYSQNVSYDSLVVKTLNLVKDTTDISVLKESLNTHYSLYAKHFNYIPSLNPLNPKKLKRYSSQFGRRFHPIDKEYKRHLGLDISAKIGTPIHAVADGNIVQNISSNEGCGNSIMIEHKYGFTTRYCHLYVSVVKKGFKVKKGDIIGFVGSTGKSTAPHLHYEIKKNGVLIDPYPYCFLDI